MAFTKITAAGIGSTETVTLDGLSVINNESIGGNLTVTGNATVGGVLTYEDVTNVDSVGLITARNGIVVGSGITLSKDGDGFFTGVVTATSFSGSGALLTGVASTENIRTNTNATFLQNINVSGTTTAAGNINVSGANITLGDSASTSDDRLTFGAGPDLQIFHNGTDSVITNATGDLYINNNADTIIKPANDCFIKPQDGESGIEVIGNGAVKLYYDNSKKLETASGGVTVTGTVAATSYTGDGSALTGIEVGLSTASAQVSGITTVIDLSKDDIRLDCTGLVTIDAKGGTEGGSHSLRIVNSGIATVSFNSYFKFPSGGAPNLPTASGAISLISFTVHTQGRVGVASVFLAGSSVNFS